MNLSDIIREYFIEHHIPANVIDYDIDDIGFLHSFVEYKHNTIALIACDREPRVILSCGGTIYAADPTMFDRIHKSVTQSIEVLDRWTK